MKFKATVVSLLAAMLAVITVGMSMMVMEAKKQTEAVRDTAYIEATQAQEKISTEKGYYIDSAYANKVHDDIWNISRKYKPTTIISS